MSQATQSITFRIAPELRRHIEQQAQSAGQSMAAYLTSLIEADIENRNHLRHVQEWQQETAAAFAAWDQWFKEKGHPHAHMMPDDHPHKALISEDQT